MTGADGAVAAPGANGLGGALGADGAVGATGLTPAGAGATGAAGSVGGAGTQGVDGDTGATGSDGATGTAGQAGGNGAAGPDSNAGNNGVAGNNGSAGNGAVDGLDGALGVDGANGNAGANGAGGSIGVQGGSDGVGGLGGVAVVGVGDTTVINDGLIAGGFSFGGAIQANAIEFTNGGNLLELWSNYQVQGNVIASIGPVDTFALGGTADGTFDAGLFGVQYQNFQAFEKNGTSLWTLTGTTGELTPWKLNDGILSVSEDGALGDLAGGVTFDGGTLQITGTAFTTTPRDLTILDGGGGIDIADPLNVFTLNQPLIGGLNSGKFWKQGQGTLVLNGVNTYAGRTEVLEGTLVLGDTAGSPASVLGDVYVVNDVNNGIGLDGVGTLAGHGTIGGDLINDGIVSPGYNNDHGTLTVRGDYFADTSGTLVIKLDGIDGGGVQNDLLAVDGNVYLEGTTLELSKVNFELGCGEQATVITANQFFGGVDSFDISDFDKLMLFDNGTGGTGEAIVYGVNVQQGQGFEDLPGLNDPQPAIAEVFSDYVLDGTNIIDLTDPLDAAVVAIIEECGGAGDVLDQLSPEGYAGFVDYGIQVTRNYTRTALNAPGARPYSEPEPIQEKGAKGGIPDAKGGMAVAETHSSKNTTIFGGFSHYDGGSDSSDNGADYDIQSNGAIIGARHQINAFSFGGFLGYDQGDVSSKTVDADVDGWVLGAFGTFLANADHNILITAGATYGNYDFDGDRRTLGGKASFDGGDTDALDIYASVEGDVWKNDKFRITPSLGLHYIQAETDSIEESGSLLGLDVDSQDEDALLAEIDVKFEYKVLENVVLLGTVGYTYNFMDSDRDVDASFQAGGGNFRVTAPGLGEHTFTAGIGAVWYVTDALSIGVNYRAEISSDSDLSNSVGVGASYSF